MTPRREYDRLVEAVSTLLEAALEGRAPSRPSGTRTSTAPTAQRPPALLLIKCQGFLGSTHRHPLVQIYQAYPPTGISEALSRKSRSSGRSPVSSYALGGLPNKVVAAEYRTALPDERLIAAELERTRRVLDERRALRQKLTGRDAG